LKFWHGPVQPNVGAVPPRAETEPAHFTSKWFENGLGPGAAVGIDGPAGRVLAWPTSRVFRRPLGGIESHTNPNMNNGLIVLLHTNS
jgi:hypothetical protein